MRLGVDIGGTKIAVGLVTLDGGIRRRACAPAPAAQGPRAVVRVAAELAHGPAAGGRARAAGAGPQRRARVPRG
ncbi:hypothetical protein [Nonomuraea aridisoli]|uniref:hypothetical protein n=1 Tax=Nonomuraea aridisoli TaxID=2070368 RepID=UPI0022A89BBD|nr:hypothetical protein [Nonomuraea aridisoli]